MANGQSITAFKIVRDTRFILFYEVKCKAIARKILWSRQCLWLNSLPSYWSVYCDCIQQKRKQKKMAWAGAVATGLNYTDVTLLPCRMTASSFLQLTFIRFQFLSYYTYLVFFFGFYKATVMSSSETKKGWAMVILLQSYNCVLSRFTIKFHCSFCYFHVDL